MIFIYMQAFMIFHLMTMTLALRNDKNKKLNIPTIQQFDIVVDNTNEENPSYTVYSYSNEPPLHTYNTDESTYIDALDDETFFKDTMDKNNSTNCEKNIISEEEIMIEDMNAFSPPKIIKECNYEQNIPYGEIVYSVYEEPLKLISEDFILDNVECNKDESVIEDDNLLYGEIIYVADQETTDLVSQAYAGENKEQKNEALVQNMNPLMNMDSDNINHKEKDSVKDLIGSNKKGNIPKEGLKASDDKDNGVCLFSIVGIVVVVMLNM
ncbi:hypothetical protein H311_01968 [Anncaliia algerae PRA109]|nr:hypothetical protein H311_01968 [Anncaliia algerae PRA109]